MKIWNFINRQLIQLRCTLENMSDRSAASEDGSTTVEYAIGVVAAAAFAGVLLAILKSGAVKQLIQAIVERALKP